MGRAERTRLARESRSLGPATLPGRLYDLGTYPGLVEDGGGGLVHGEVVLLEDAASSLRWLDAYEGIPPGACEGEEYIRVERAAGLSDGSQIKAWVYVYKGSMSGGRLVPTGRWIGTTASHPRK